MRVLAFCDERYEVATRKVVAPPSFPPKGGKEEVEVITSPPVYAYDFEHEWLSDRDFIYVDLHGQPGGVYLYSGVNQERAALQVDDVRRAKLDRAIVFATTCYLPETPFLGAFLEAGAGAVIGGQEENFGARTRMSGAQRLARLLLGALRRGKSLDEAWKLARTLLRANPLSWVVDAKATADTLEFEIWRA